MSTNPTTNNFLKLIPEQVRQAHLLSDFLPHVKSNTSEAANSAPQGRKSSTTKFKEKEKAPDDEVTDAASGNKFLTLTSEICKVNDFEDGAGDKGNVHVNGTEMDTKHNGSGEDGVKDK